MPESSPTQEPARFDPFEYWRQFYEANEQAWTKAVKDVTGTRDFAEAQGKVLETFLAFQKVMRDNMTAQMKTLNLPTRDDVARLGELLLGVEEKVDRLIDGLEGLERRIALLDRGIEARAKQMDERWPDLEKRLADRGKALEGKVEKLDDRLGGAEGRLVDQTKKLEKRVDTLADKVAGLAERRAPKAPASEPAAPTGGRSGT